MEWHCIRVALPLTLTAHLLVGLPPVASAEQNLVVVQHFTEELKRLVPSD